MNGDFNIVFKQIVDHPFQCVPALYRYLDAQCDMAIEAMENFIRSCLSTGQKPDHVMEFKRMALLIEQYFAQMIQPIAE